MQTFLRYKDIIYYRTLAGLKSEARKNYLGYIWFVAEPLLSTAVLYFVMSQVTGQRGVTAVFSILLGMVVWQWFEGSVMLSAGSIAAKFHIHQQVPLPKYLFPLVDAGSNTVRFFFAYALILAACLVWGSGPTAALLWLPAILLLQLLLIVGATLVISLLVTLVNDLRVLVQSVFRLLFFVSGIFFTADRVPGHLLPWFHANPLAVLIESQRAVVLDGTAPDGGLLLQVAVIAAALIGAGSALHAYYDKRLLKLTNV